MRARDISIHAPHAGRDAGDKYITGSNCISIHAPLAGCDVEHIQHTVWFSPYFNPRAPCGARQGDHLGGTPLRAISIHAPHAGRDRCRRSDRRGKYYFNPRAPCGARPRRLIRPTPRPTFQSTRPVRGATSKKPITELRCQISIHAPRAGRDCSDVARCSCQRDFNPRAPCGARRGQGCSSSRRTYFNPRAPCGARQGPVGPSKGAEDFNPRAPCGARP